MHVGNALEYFEQIQKDEAFDMFYKHRVQDFVSAQNNEMRGIYIREPNSNVTRRFVWNISPKFIQYQYQKEQSKRQPILQEFENNGENANNVINLQLQDNNENYKQTPLQPLCNFKTFGLNEQINYQRVLNFKLLNAQREILSFDDENNSFIEISKHVTLTTLGKDIPILIHVDQIAKKYGPGAHYFSLEAYIPQNEPVCKDLYPQSIGKTLFTLPITIIIPELNDYEKNLQIIQERKKRMMKINK